MKGRFVGGGDGGAGVFAAGEHTAQAIHDGYGGVKVRLCDQMLVNVEAGVTGGAFAGASTQDVLQLLEGIVLE